MTLSEIRSYVCSKLGQSDATTQTLVTSFISFHYQRIYNSALWKDSLLLVSTTSSVPGIILPHNVARVLGVRYNNQQLFNMELGNILQINPSVLDGLGDPITFAHDTEIGTAVLPTGKVKVVSDSASDVSLKVFIRGEYQGSAYREEITLSGLSSQTSVNNYDVIHVYAKPVTVGNVTLTDVSSTSNLQTLWPEETARRNTRIKVFSDFTGSSKTFLILCKRRCDPMVKDSDSPTIQGIDQALTRCAESELLERQKQFQKADMKMGQANALVQEMIEQETQQQANQRRVMPVCDPDGYSNPRYMIP